MASKRRNQRHDWEISMDELEMGEILGAGGFGEVYKVLSSLFSSWPDDVGVTDTSGLVGLGGGKGHLEGNGSGSEGDIGK